MDTRKTRLLRRSITKEQNPHIGQICELHVSHNNPYEVKAFAQDGQELRLKISQALGYEGNNDKFKYDLSIPSTASNYSDFDELFFIDTNTKNNHSITCIIRLFPKLGEYDEKPIYFSFSASGADPEKTAILHLIEVLQEHNCSREKTYGIFTDTDLGNHEIINSRTSPLYNDFFLPLNFKLLYASSDRGGHVLNLNWSEPTPDGEIYHFEVPDQVFKIQRKVTKSRL